MKSRSRLEVVLLTALFVLAAACTKKKAFVDKVDEDGNGYMAKSALQGKEYYLSAGIQDSQDDNQLLNATPGMNIDYGIVRAEITKDELRFIEVFNPQNRSETAEILAAYAITKHFDIEREKNDFGEQTHKLIENTDRPWDQRAYIRVDWKQPVANRSKLDFQTMYGIKKMAVENADLIEEVQYKDGHLQFAVDATLIQEGAGAWGSAKNARIVMRTHLVEVAKSDFAPLQYSEADFSRFGLFFTQQLFTDPIKGLRESGVKHFAEKFNICKPDTGRSCSTNVVKWNLTEGFPQEYIALTKKAVEQYNVVLKKILNREDDVVVLDQSKQVNLTDPTVNTIAYYGPDQGGLGVRQNQVDPRTGEIKSARVVMYGAGINGIMGQVDDYIDELIKSGEAASIGLGDKMGEDKKEIANLMSKVSLGLKFSNLTALQKQKARRMALGLSTQAKANFPDLKSQVSAVREHISSEKGNLAAKFSRMTDFASKDRSNLEDMEKLASMKIDFGDKSNLVRGLLNKSTSLLAERTKANEAVRFANVQIEAEGLHNAEFIEDATLRFIERTLKEAGSIEKLAAQREVIKKKVAENVYYDTVLHEMGHAFGLRHNFASSADANNFTEEYKERATQAQKDPSIVAEDLYGLAYTSVMDYPADFYLMEGGLGPYDKAALEYSYGELGDLAPAARNSLLANLEAKKTPHPLLAPRFKFCTDDNAGEDVTCRRWDRGVNASMITDHAIKSSNSRYLMNHFRRGRVNFSFNRVLSRTYGDLVQIRQPMDELLYRLITTQGLMERSIQLGEMADIQKKPEEAAVKLGVDGTDYSTYHLALFKEDGSLRMHPSQYEPNGFADLLYASMLATNHFQDVLGAPLPGFYVAIDYKGSAENVALVKLPEADSLEAALADVARERGEDPEVFIAKYGNRLLQMKAGRFARYLESTGSGDQIHRKSESIGFFWDKYIAMIVLGARDLGVAKYYEASMTANAYLLPQSQKIVHQMFEKLMTSNEKHLTVLPVLLPGTDEAGQPTQVQKMALVPAAVNADIEAYSTLLSLSTFSATTDRSFMQSTRICVDNETCVSGKGAEWTKFIGANNNQYKAAQTLENNSIAVAMVKNGAELNKKVAELSEKIANRGELKKKVLAKAKKNKADRAKSDFGDRLVKFTGDSILADALTKAFGDMVGVVELIEADARPKMVEQFYAAIDALNVAQQDWIKKALAKTAAAGENPQACQQQNPDGTPKVKCPVFDEVMKLYSELQKTQQQLYSTPSEALGLASLELEVKAAKRDTNALESKIQFLRSVHAAVNEF